MPSKKLYSSTDRDLSHTKLEELIKQYPHAECREDHNSEEPFQVWDGPADRALAPPAGKSDEDTEFSAEELRALKALLRAAKEK